MYKRQSYDGSAGLRKPAEPSYEHQEKSGFNWTWLIILGFISLIRFLAHDGAGGTSSSKPDEATKYFERGTHQLKQGDTKGAIVSFTRVLELKPDDQAALGNRAAAYLETAQDLRASEDLEKLAALDASNPGVYRGRGLVALRAGHYTEAITAFTRSLELAPGNEFSLMKRAYAYEKIGELNKALADIDETLRVNKTSGAAPYVLRIKILRTQGDTAKAIAQIEPMLAAAPADVNAYMTAADLHMRLNQRQQAVEVLNRGVLAAPDADIYLYRAQLRPRSDKQGRQRDIDSGIALEPHSINANRLLAELEFDNGNLPAAIETLTKLLNDDNATGSLTAILVQRGIVHLKMGNPSLAKADFGRARETAKTASQKNEVAWELAVHNVELPTALSIIDEALKSQPDNDAFIDSKGFILLRLGRYREAIEQYDVALKLRPGEPAYLFGRGIAKRRSGRTSAGEADLKAARAAQPYVDTKFSEMGVTP